MVWYGIKISSRKYNRLPILLYQVIFQQLMNLDYAMLSLSEHSGFPHPNKWSAGPLPIRNVWKFISWPYITPFNYICFKNWSAQSWLWRDSTYIIYYILQSFLNFIQGVLKKVFIMLPLYAWGCSYIMLGRGYKRIFCTKEEILFFELADWLVVNALPLNMRKMPDSWCSSLHFGTLHLHQQYFPCSQRTTTLDPFHTFLYEKQN